MSSHLDRNTIANKDSKNINILEREYKCKTIQLANDIKIR